LLSFLSLVSYTA